MDPDQDNHDWVNKYKLVAYRWKRRLVAKSGGIGISAVVCIYVCMYLCMYVCMYAFMNVYECMYVLYVLYMNSWCPNRAYVGHEVALINSQGDTLQAYINWCGAIYLKS